MDARRLQPQELLPKAKWGLFRTSTALYFHTEFKSYFPIFIHSKTSIVLFETATDL